MQLLVGAEGSYSCYAVDYVQHVLALDGMKSTCGASPPMFDNETRDWAYMGAKIEIQP